MDKEKALQILIANAYCTILEVSCTECPLYDENAKIGYCNHFDDNDLLKAIEVIA